MRDTNRQLLISAARLLRPLLEELVFVGACVTGLLITDEAAPSVRATLDVDAIAEKVSSRDQMRRHDADELARRDHLGLLPELREMPLVACHQVIGAGGIGALQELVVAGVLRGVQRARRLDNLRMVLDELQELQAEPLRILSSGRASTSRYSVRIAPVTYNLAGLVIASKRTVRRSSSGFRAAETRMLVSMTSLSGIIQASVFARAWP